MKNFYLNTEKNKIYIAKYPFDIISKVEKDEIIILICEKEIKTNDLIKFKKENENFKQFLFLCNSIEEKNICDKQKIYSSFINKNCFIDESIFKIEENIIKEEKGIYVTALKQKKRIHLCQNINEINLLVNYSQQPEQHINLNGINILNKEFVKKHDLYKYYNKALFGCIFSIQDCSSNVSCEYLLSGLPVLTTRSSGGRNIWYNKYNHILIEPNQNSLKEAISLCKEKIEKGIFNSELIRRKQLKLMLDFRFKFNKLVSQISNLNLEECIEKFNENFFIFQ